MPREKGNGATFVTDGTLASSAVGMSSAARRKREQSKQVQQSQAPDLLVFGYEVAWFTSPATWSDIEAGRFLMPCHGRTDLLVDRFDVRLLIESMNQVDRPVPKAAFTERERIEETELDIARYEDMEAADARLAEGLKRSRVASLTSAEEAKKRENASGGFHQAAEIEKPKEPSVSSENFQPPFTVLPGLLVPGTARLHTIIDTTAKFVHQQGEQAEIRLRLQHKDNTSFSFLLIDDPMHPYYKFVRTLISEGVETAIPPPPPPPPAATAPTEPPLAPLAVAPVVVPPQEQKAIIDKLVEMVQKHGLALENTVRAREGVNPKFAFLQSGHVWHSYYKQQLRLPPPSARSGLAMLAAYSDDDDDSAPTATVSAAIIATVSSIPTTSPPLLPDTLSPTPVVVPAVAAQPANTSIDNAAEALKKQRLARTHLLASKLNSTTATSQLPPAPSVARRSLSPSQQRDRSASPRRRSPS